MTPGICGKRKIVTRDGATIAFDERGSGCGTVVLLHSLGTDGRIWDECLEQLEPENRVIVVDCRGHGASGPGTVHSVDQWVEDLREVLDSTGTNRAVLVGISLGGIQALAFAAAYPGMVIGLVVADSFVALPPDVAKTKVSSLVAQAESESMAAVADRYVADTFRTPYPSGAEIVRRAISSMDLQSYTAAVKVCFGVQITDRLPLIPSPTLVLWGEHDAKAPRSLSEQIVDGLADARLSVIPHAGHLSNVDNPAGFLAELKVFSASVMNDRPGPGPRKEIEHEHQS